MSASPEEISRILCDMRLAIDAGKYTPINRDKNLASLTKLGIRWPDAIEEIYNLTEKNYDSGPDIDRDYPQTDLFWKFKKTAFGHLIYIKFKMLYKENGELKVVSFHIADYQ